MCNTAPVICPPPLPPSRDHWLVGAFPPCILGSHSVPVVPGTSYHLPEAVARRLPPLTFDVAS